MALSKVNPLVTALANGQPKAYADLYDRLGQPLWQVARAMLGRSSDAEDAVQDVFLNLVRNRNRLTQIEDLDAYIFTMLRNGVLRRILRDRGERHHRDHMPQAIASEPNCPPDAELSDAMRQLPDEQREVISLKIDGDLTFAQIAVVLDISPNTAASRYRYAIEKLRRMLESK